MKIALVLAAGILVGFVLSLFIFRSKAVGTLRCARDLSEPDIDPYIFLELDKGVSEIHSRKYVVMKVNSQVITNKDYTQK